ncbi:MAG: PilZ domain-containing protein [Treponema sp.]|jgi:c-di-GMP-binding flagellar brake protein YcgR|nr:PilZ domain-containing protein [Treponema sp.]
MATPIKRIEKDFLLKVLYDEQIPIMYLRDRTEYILLLDKPAKSELVFKADRPISKLKIRQKLDLMFDYRGQVIIFTVEVSSFKDDMITVAAPEFLYKNLDRSYSRISTPTDLQVQFTFLGDRYHLSFPKVTEYESGEIGGFVRDLDPRNLSGLIEQMAGWIKGYANGYKLVIFKDVKPASTEERIVAETGKTLYLPSTLANFPQADPYPKKRLITEEMFKRYLESTGVNLEYVDSACARFIKAKFDSGIFSDAWIPVLFQEYVIGYIHIWINKEGKLPFDYGVIDTLYQFAKVLAFSLKENGYFDGGKLKNEPFEGKVVDISASGILFAYPHSSLASALLPDSELAVKLISPRRIVKTNARIVRRYKDNSLGYFGCRFLDMAPEDMRFLFEYIYGKPFTDTDASFLSGQV